MVDDKPGIGTILRPVSIAGLAVACCLGPVVLATTAGGIASWLGGLDLMVAAAIALPAGVTIYGIVRWRKARAGFPARSRPPEKEMQ